LILVTGSSGRVGRKVVAALLDQGRTVRGFDLIHSGRDDAQFKEVVGSLDDPAAVALATEGLTYVLHLGAFMSWAQEDRGAMFRTNVEGTRLLLDASASADRKSVV
jgi:UDP-glucose 4-epimerase